MQRCVGHVFCGPKLRPEWNQPERAGVLGRAGGLLPAVFLQVFLALVPWGRPAMADVVISCSDQRPGIALLGWDTEGGSRGKTNLLRANEPVGLRVRVGDQWKSGSQFAVTRASCGQQGATYRLAIDDDAELSWTIAQTAHGLKMDFSVTGTRAQQVQGLRLVFPFHPRVTPTTVLPRRWMDDGSLRLPAVISAPDYGQMLLAEAGGREVTALLEGSRSATAVDLIVSVPVLKAGQVCTLNMTPVHLPPPKGLRETAFWAQARRGWFGALQPSARWGDQGHHYSAPAGVLSNNVISDPASCSLWFYADQALWTPEVAPGISVAALVRRTLDWWLDHRVRPTGEVVCYWNYGNFLDANAGPLIAAWDYVEASGDETWLRRRITRLEFIADFLAKRDVDGDGMVDAVQSGNRNTLHEPTRSCCWFDALNHGGKCGYSNAVIYRAWRCLAELEGRLGRDEQQSRYHALADRLKAAYEKTLYNPATGWLAGWKSRDGELHDYASPVVNGIAIEYGLVEPELGRKILERLWAKIDQVGFKRLDLGVPMTLEPVRRSDYLQPGGLGVPTREDGTDTLGHYMNGGITAGHVLHFLAAHYVVGRPEKADRLLQAMLHRMSEGRFPNGVRSVEGQGIVDWYDWNGNHTGYEGYLADNFRFLQAVLLRESTFREVYHGPLHHQPRRKPTDQGQ